MADLKFLELPLVLEGPCGSRVKEVVQRTTVVSHEGRRARKWKNYWEFISGSIMHRRKRLEGRESRRKQFQFSRTNDHLISHFHHVRQTEGGNPR